MAQVNIKDRIREMRLRVLAEPAAELEPAVDEAIEIADQSLVVSKSIQNSGETVSEKKIVEDSSVKKKSAQEKKITAKNTGNKKNKRPSKKTHKTNEDTYLSEELETLAKTNGNCDANEILADEEKDAPKPSIEQSYSIENTQSQNEDISDGIVNLTDKWVELEVRSRLSGLEQQEKQTRAMLREIVDLLDRIENSEYVKPNERTQALPSIKPIHQVAKSKKFGWPEIIKRLLTVIGTFFVLTGIIGGILFYLLY